MISIILVIIIVVLMKCKPDLLNGIVGQIIYVILFAMWVAGVAVCTFQKPFAPGPTGYGLTGNYGVAGNGYFGTWLCAIFSGVLVYLGVPPITEGLGNIFGGLDEAKKLLLGIFAASIVEMWHAARVCDKSWWCTGMLAWGVAAGAVSAGLVLIWVLLLQFTGAVTAFTKFFAIFLALWWISAVCSLTMPNNSSCDYKDTYCQGLFLDVSNGFLGCWAAMVLSIYFAVTQWGVSMPAGGGDGGGGSAAGGGEEKHEHKEAPVVHNNPAQTDAVHVDRM